MMALEYQTALFKRETIVSLKDHYLEILKQVIVNGSIRLQDVSISYDLLAAAPDAFEDEDEEFDL